MKKALCVLISVLMLCCVFPLAAFAAAKPEVDTSKPPIILIDGINATELLRDVGEKTETQAFPFSGDDIMNVVKAQAPAIWDMLDGDFSAESERAVLDAVLGLTESFAMNNDGTSKYNVTANWFYPGEARPVYEEETSSGSAGDKLSAFKDWLRGLFQKAPEELTEAERLQRLLEKRSTYKFQYDWRLDPFETAERLHEYIAFMKELTGYDTVSLVGFSMGAAVLNTYLTVYGSEGLDSVIWYAGAHRGVELAGQIFTGNINVDASALTDFVNENGNADASAELLGCFMKALRSIGVTGGVLNYTNAIINTLLEDGGVRAILRETVGKMPGVWSLIGEKYYEAAKAYVFSEPGDAETFAPLIEKIDRYHYGVQAHSDELMAAAEKATGKIGVISKYGLRVVPVINNKDVAADGLIDVAASSCGAVAAAYGKTLGGGYTQAVSCGHNHLSPDGVIDASAALYPEYTWFIKNLQHANTPGYVYDLFSFIAHADHQVTVNENPDFPQFAVYSPIEGVCRPLASGGRDNAFTRAFLRVKVYFMNLLQRLRAFFCRD